MGGKGWKKDEGGKEDDIGGAMKIPQGRGMWGSEFDRIKVGFALQMSAIRLSSSSTPFEIYICAEYEI